MKCAGRRRVGGVSDEPGEMSCGLGLGRRGVGGGEGSVGCGRLGGRSRTATTGFCEGMRHSDTIKQGRWAELTWSEVVYEGTDVYKAFVMVDFVGVSGLSVYVAYMTRSVHDGWRLRLREDVNKPDTSVRAKSTHSYLSTSPSLYL